MNQHIDRKRRLGALMFAAGVLACSSATLSGAITTMAQGVRPVPHSAR